MKSLNVTDVPMVFFIPVLLISLYCFYIEIKMKREVPNLIKKHNCIHLKYLEDKTVLEQYIKKLEKKITDLESNVIRKQEAL